jgi:hypothetical protein
MHAHDFDSQTSSLEEVSRKIFSALRTISSNILMDQWDAFPWRSSIQLG